MSARWSGSLPWRTPFKSQMLLSVKRTRIGFSAIAVSVSHSCFEKNVAAYRTARRFVADASTIAMAYPLNLTDGKCDLGYFCPNTTYTNFTISFQDPTSHNWTNFTFPDERTWPAACPATPNCAIRRLESQFCGAQGLYEPVLCPGGKTRC